MHTNDKHQYPGFLKKNVHSKGHCVPCCVKEWNSNLQKTRRHECMIDNEEKTNKSDKLDALIYEDVSSVPRYIISFDSFVKKDTFGFLTPSLQDYFLEDYSKKLTPGNIHQIKENTSCLLRYGWDDHPTQSFIGCLAYAYYEYHDYNERYDRKLNKVKSISEFKDLIKKQVTLDEFISLQNGSLINIFKPTADSSRAIGCVICLDRCEPPVGLVSAI